MKTLILLFLTLSSVSFIHTENTLLKNMVDFITQHFKRKTQGVSPP